MSEEQIMGVTGACGRGGHHLRALLTGHPARLHLPAFSAIICGPLTELWPMEYEQS